MFERTANFAFDAFFSSLIISFSQRFGSIMCRWGPAREYLRFKVLFF